MCETPGLLFILNRLRRELHAALEAGLASDKVLFSLELTPAQFAIVAALATAEATSSTDLCERTAYDAGAMTRMLDRLQAKGLIRRRRSLEDRRVVHLELTEKCRTGLPRMRQASTEVVERALRGFSSAEVRELQSYLSRLLWNVEPAVA